MRTVKRPFFKSMRVAYIFAWPHEKEFISHPEQVPVGGNWAIINALRHLGHTVFPINLYNDKGDIDSDKARIEYQQHVKEGLDMAFVFDTGRAKCAWKQMSGDYPVIYHAGDDPMRYDANVDCLLEGDYDGILCAQKPFVKKYAEQFDVPTEWLPYHADPLIHYPEIVSKVTDINHSGKIYSLREPIINAYLENNITVNVEGSWGSQFRRNYRGSRIGWHHAWCGEVGYRHFEIPAMGIPLLCDKLHDSYGLDEIYPRGCVYLYDGDTDEKKVENAVEAARYILDNYAEAQANAKIVYNHIVNEHSALARAEQMIQFATNKV